MFFIRYLAFQKFGAVVLEHALLIASVFAFQVRGKELEPASYVSSFASAFGIAIVFQLSLHLRDVYDFGTKPWSPKTVAGFLQAILLASLIILAIQQGLPAFAGREFPAMVITASIVLLSWHILVRLYFGRSGRRANVLIMGTGQLARSLATEILRHRELGLAIKGFVDDDPSLLGVSIVNPKVIGLSNQLVRVVTDHRIDEIVVELGDRRGRLPIDELLKLKMRGIKITEAASLYEHVTGKIATENLKPSWMVFGEGFQVSRRVLFLKQVISFFSSLVLLLLVLPLFPLIALIIKLDSSGPIFFSQERVGKNGKSFTLWKFRSMCRDAEKNTGPVWAKQGDHRVTRVGKLLRRTRLDELPQLINVLKGDMSMVGPRPERPKFVEELAQTIPFYHLRHAVKPGITGWAQISYRYGSSIEDAVEKLQYDLFYIKHMSCVLDLLIILATIKTVLLRKGS